MKPRATIAWAALASCTPSASPKAPAEAAAVAPTATASAPSAPAAAKAKPEAKPEPVLLVTDPQALGVIESGPGSLAALLGTPNATTLHSLAELPAYASILAVIKSDLERVRASDPLAGTSVARHAHRLLDARWLASEHARFELVAVSNRFDRRPFAGSACGELRLVYRLSYETSVGDQRVASRMPITLVAELAQDPADAQGGCRAPAERWFAPPGLEHEKLGAWLIGSDGPLGGERASSARLLRLNANFQSVRWPSTVRPDLGGHAEYVLRTFVRDGARFRPEVLENTPDIARLASQPKLKSALFEWLAQPDNLARIDMGTALLPREFLAGVSVSVTPHGLARLANRPYRQVFSAKDFAGLDLSRYPRIRSPEALLRRLDDLSCPGCHQSRTLAGFHLLGVDGPNTAAGNALGAVLSPHVVGDLPRRRRLLERAAAGEPQIYFTQPFAERAEEGEGGYGSHCGLGDPGFARWTCNPGLTCQAHDVAQGEAATVGVCLPEKKGAGDPCEPAVVRASADPHRDRIASNAELACSESASVCNRSAVGFPGGMCTADCSALPGEAACGAIAILTSFNDCLARSKPFASCIAEHSSPAGLRRCSSSTPCRDDYLCAATPSGDGTCIPPYFLFQLRVDGHPSP